VLQLEAIYYFAVVLLEVPSGYFSDRVGRIATLRLSSVFGVLTYCLFFFGDSFGTFVVAQACLATHFSFRSGTDTAWHYDLLEELGLEDEFAAREARLARATFWVRSVCALVGGAVGTFALSGGYALSCAAAAVVAVLMFASQEQAPTESDRAGSFVRQLGLLWASEAAFELGVDRPHLVACRLVLPGKGPAIRSPGAVTLARDLKWPESQGSWRLTAWARLRENNEDLRLEDDP